MPAAVQGNDGGGVGVDFALCVSLSQLSEEQYEKWATYNLLLHNIASPPTQL